MKVPSILFACFLVLCGPARATELSLEGATTAAGKHAAPEVAAKVHLNLGSREEGTDVPLGAPALDTVSAGLDVASAPVVPASPAPGAWTGEGATRLSAFEVTHPPRALAGLSGLPPENASVNPGVPDSWVYAGLGVLLLGLLWACAGWVKRQPTAFTLKETDERGSERPRRVRMVALKTGR